MESAVFHLNSEELDMRFVESIKSFFKNRRIKVIITPDDNDTVVDNQLLEAIERGENATIAYTIPGDEFDQLADKFIENNEFEVIEAMKKYATVL
jgi:hypothetical protein